MLIEIQGDWIDPATIWRLSYDDDEKSMCVYMSREGEQVKSLVVNVDRAFVDDVAARVNAAMSGNVGVKEV